MPEPNYVALIRTVKRSAAMLAVLLLLAAPTKLHALTDHSQTCDQVAAEAARRTGVPISVLKAITRTETGQKRNGAFRPWPWTVNMEGKGVWFDTEDEARAYVYKEFKRGARSFDVGCFQINYKWHGKAFTSIDEMFDPLTNALYAARFLGELYAEHGNWGGAAGAYHSRTPEFANRYKVRFQKFRAALMADDGREIPEIPDIVRVANGGADQDVGLAEIVRVNTYPLLQSGTAGELGSLVPLGNGVRAGLFVRAHTSGVVN